MQGGVDASHIERRSVEVPSRVVRGRGVVACVKVVVAWPSHSILEFFIQDIPYCSSYSDVSAKVSIGYGFRGVFMECKQIPNISQGGDEAEFRKFLG